MKRSMFAKLLIMILCLALVLCGCSDSAGNDDVDGEKKGSSKVEVNNDEDDPDNNEDEGPAQNVAVTPEEKAEVALSKTLGAIFSADADVDVLEDALECGKITISVGDYVDNVLYIDSNDFQIADELSLNIEGFQLDAELYFNEEDLVLAMPGVVDGAYGIHFDSLATDLEQSAIWGLMGVDYETAMAELGVALEEITSVMDTVDPTMNDLEGALEDALANVDKTVTEGTANVDGEDVDAIIVTYSMDSAAMQEMVEVMIDWYAGYMDDMANSFAGFVEVDMDMDELTAELDAAKNSVEDFFVENELKAELVVNINAETGYIMTAEGEFSGVVDGDEGGVYLSVDLGKDASKSDEYSIELISRGDDGEAGISLVLERETNGTETVYELTMSASDDSEMMELMTATLTYDSASYEYEISLASDGEEFAINGICKLTANEFELSLDSATSYGETVDIGLVLKVEAISASQIPQMPASYINLLTMSENDWMDLITELSMAFGG